MATPFRGLVNLDIRDVDLEREAAAMVAGE
jgi:hypothetical protein